MYVPLVSPAISQRLYPRKGGGGGGHGSSGHGSSSGKGGSSSSGKGGSSSSTKGSPKTVHISGSTSGWSSASAYGGGSKRVYTIPAGQPFAGRTSGGATRSQIYGTSIYGSGYPGLGIGSVYARPFPFVFWPVSYGPGFGYGPAYLHDNEYGWPDNTSRPGGPMAQATFISNSTGSNSTFFLLSDNSTVASLISSIADNCTLGSGSSTAPSPYNATSDQPKPEQAVAYYRASSIVLMLNGYNDTASLTDPNGTATSFPGWVDTTLLDCLNQTIGQAAPLFSGTPSALPNVIGSFALVTVLYSLMITILDL